jgi:hypothetical protein
MAREETLVFAAVGDALERRTVDELKKRLALLPIDAKVTRKGDIAELIAEYLAGDRLHTLWKRLDKTQKLAVAETLYAADGRFDGIRFAAKYGESPNWGSKTDSWGYSTVPSLLQLFIYESLIPEDLQGRLKEFVPRPDETILETVSDDKLPPYLLRQEQWHDPDTRELVTDTVEIPVVYQGTERVAAVELRSMLRLIEAGKVGVSDTTRLPTAAALKAVAALLEGDDYFPPDPEEDDNVLEPAGPIRAFAWPMIVQAAGLAELSGKKLTLSRAGQKALSAPPHETLRAAWRRWLKTKLLDELRRISIIKGQTGKGKTGLTALEPRRTAVANALTECPEGEWVSVNRFLLFMVAENYTFEVTRDPWSLYISEAGYGSLGYDGSHDWAILQARYVLCLLFEYAATLGLLDIGYVPPNGARSDYRDLWGTDDLDFLSRYDGLLFFRLNPLGAYCLGLTEEYAPPPQEERLVLEVRSPQEIIELGPPLSSEDELILEAFAESSNDDVWRLEPVKILAAVEAGRAVSELEGFLQSRSGNRLPDSVQSFLADLTARAKRLSDRGSARLIECADAALAAQIASEPRLKKLCLRAGETHLVVPSASEPAFRKALREFGYILPPPSAGRG